MQETKEQQDFFMKRALALGEKGRLTAPPNPWVGCVIVYKGEIIGEGFHAEPGTPHAEIVALEQAKTKFSKIDGASVYITLEPCFHHGRTPPCFQALIKAGIGHVIIPLLDPDPKVNGKGVEGLKQVGIKVTVGVCEREALESLEPYLFHRTTGRPFTILKAASSIDGKIAAKDGSSKWISSSEARENAHQLRALSQGILVGRETAQKDKPLLTVRAKDLTLLKQPKRIVLDPLGKLPLEGPLFDQALASTLIITSKECPPQKYLEWEKFKLEHVTLNVDEEGINLDELLEELGKRGILQLLVEGGSRLQSSFLKRGLANRLVLYLGSCLIGNNGKSIFNFSDPETIEEALLFSLIGVTRFESDLRLDYNLSSRI